MSPALRFTSVRFSGTGNPAEFALGYIVPAHLQTLDLAILISHRNQDSPEVLYEAPTPVLCVIEPRHARKVEAFRMKLLGKQCRTHNRRCLIAQLVDHLISQALLQEETRKELIAAVNALADLERDILIRRYYYEQKPREIAKALDLSVKQVDNYLYRSKQKLRHAVTAY